EKTYSENLKSNGQRYSRGGSTRSSARFANCKTSFWIRCRVWRMLHYGLPPAKVLLDGSAGTVLMGFLVSAHNRRTDRQIRVVDLALDIRTVFCSGSDFHSPGSPRIRSIWSRETFNDVFRCLFS